MLREILNGFCMALADSVPGVSGGTVAFIMGFYDNLINSIHSIIFGDFKSKIIGFRYLIKLAIGWIIGMVLAVIALTNLFNRNVYFVCSLFIGFIVASIPLILKEERESFRDLKKGIIFFVIGLFVVVFMTWIKTRIGTSNIDLSNFNIILGLKLFFIGMVAISAMFLPGISGSTFLLIFGVYIPIIMALRELISLNFVYLPSILCFVMGILAGVAVSIKIIKVSFEKFHVQTMYLILGMMIGSIYSVIMGPTTLDILNAPLTIEKFKAVAAIIGVFLVVEIYKIKNSKLIA